MQGLKREEKFKLKDFFDEFCATGKIPMALNRRQMNGWYDEINMME